MGTASAARGQKAFGAIEVPAGVDAGTRIAVAVVHGAKPGPVLALVAGAHGTEYASIVAVSKLIERLDPAEVSGTRHPRSARQRPVLRAEDRRTSIRWTARA